MVWHIHWVYMAMVNATKVSLACNQNKTSCYIKAAINIKKMAVIGCNSWMTQGSWELQLVSSWLVVKQFCLLKQSNWLLYFNSSFSFFLIFYLDCKTISVYIYSEQKINKDKKIHFSHSKFWYGIRTHGCFSSLFSSFLFTFLISFISCIYGYFRIWQSWKLKIIN